MDCYACQLTQGQKDLPGGRVHRTQHWAVEHCTGPFGVGTLIIKPLRHCLHLWELTGQETAEEDARGVFQKNRPLTFSPLRSTRN